MLRPGITFLKFFCCLTTVCTIVVLTSCTRAPKTQLIEEETLSAKMPFIRDGITSRQEILNRLGEPVSSFENGRIQIYWMEEVIGGHLRDIRRRSMPKTPDGVGWEMGLHNLVLVYNSDNVLEKHSLVFIR